MAERADTFDDLDGVVVPPTPQRGARHAERPTPQAAASRPSGQASAWWRMFSGVVDSIATLRLRPIDFVVWAVVFRHSANGEARIGIDQIARETGLCEKAVRMAMGRLRGAGLVAVKVRGRKNQGTSTYSLRLLSTGTGVPLDNQVSTGTSVPLDQFSTGTGVPVLTGTGVPVSHENERGGRIADATAAKTGTLNGTHGRCLAEVSP
ncbi:MAG: hypothetical protein U0575_07385 [Phycisphaerales bacterium]